MRLAGLYDSPLEDRIRRSLDRVGIGSGEGQGSLERLRFYGCVTDLEDEMIRALGPRQVEDVVAAGGDLPSLRRLQAMPFHRQRSLDDQPQQVEPAAQRRRRAQQRAAILVA